MTSNNTGRGRSITTGERVRAIIALPGTWTRALHYAAMLETFSGSPSSFRSIWWAHAVMAGNRNRVQAAGKGRVVDVDMSEHAV